MTEMISPLKTSYLVTNEIDTAYGEVSSEPDTIFFLE